MKQTKFRIREFKVRGIKSFKEEVNVEFFTNTMAVNFPYEGNIKALYGENGSGKTGLIHSLDTILKIITNGNFLGNDSNQKLLHELFNRESESIDLFLSVLAFNYDNSIFDAKASEELVFDISMSLKLNRLHQFYIDKQSIYFYSNQKDAKSNRDVFSLSSSLNSQNSSSYLNSKLINQTYSKSYSALLMDITFTVMDQLAQERRSSDKVTLDFEELIIKTLEVDFKEASKIKMELFYSLFLSNFVETISIHMDEGDKIEPLIKNSEIIAELNKSLDISTHTLQLPNFKVDNNVEKQREYEELLKLNLQYDSIAAKQEILHKKQIDTFEKGLRFKSEIVKLFKPDVKKIRADYVQSTPSSTYFIANLIVEYEKFDLPYYLESAGTKKIFEFATSIKNLYEGNIVIYDELDSGLHDILLSRLIEFISNHCMGQLIFTTHNLAPMDVLESKKQAIDFINGESEVVTWVKRGNSKAVNSYRNGKLKGMPHNLSADDFLSILGQELTINYD